MSDEARRRRAQLTTAARGLTDKECRSFTSLKRIVSYAPEITANSDIFLV